MRIKQILAALFFTVLIVSCGKENTKEADAKKEIIKKEGPKEAGEKAAKDINVSEIKTEFSEEFKDEFTRECVKNAKVNSSTSKAERYCSCMLDKVMTKYDSELDAGNMTVNDVLELAESCI